MISTRLAMDKIPQIDQLDTDNYQNWKLRMEAVLQYQEVWSIVSGEWGKPAEGHADYIQWTRKATKARALIMLSLHNSQLEHIRKCEGAEEIWNTLKDIHEL